MIIITIVFSSHYLILLSSHANSLPPSLPDVSKKFEQCKMQLLGN